MFHHIMLVFGLVMLPVSSAVFGFAKGRPEGFVWGYVGAICVALNAWCTGLPFWAAAGIGFIWGCWRTQPRKLFGESMIPNTWKEYGSTMLSNGVPAAFLLIPLHGSLVAQAITILAFTSSATAVAVWRATEAQDGKDKGPEAEGAQGLLMGLLLAALILMERFA